MCTKMACCNLSFSSSDEDLMAGLISRDSIRKRKRGGEEHDTDEENIDTCSSSLLDELLASEAASQLSAFVCMQNKHFYELLDMIDPLIRGQNTATRRGIPPIDRLTITLQFLGSGCSFKHIMSVFRVPINVVRNIIMDTCHALFVSLRKHYFKVPRTAKEWRRVTRQFKKQWDLPNCIGAVGGRHIKIQSESNGTAYYNREGFCSVVLSALVDANYRFLLTDLGSSMEVSEDTECEITRMLKSLDSDLLNIPGRSALPGRQKPVPHYVVGSSSCLLKPRVMRPFDVKDDLTDPGEFPEVIKTDTFNYRLSRATTVLDNAFGVLTSRFVVFQKLMPVSCKKVTRLTLACIALHNFLMTVEDEEYNPPSFLDREEPVTRIVTEGAWRQQCDELHNISACPDVGAPVDACKVRAELREYFSKEGKVIWQGDFAYSRHM